MSSRCPNCHAELVSGRCPSCKMDWRNTMFDLDSPEVQAEMKKMDEAEKKYWAEKEYWDNKRVGMRSITDKIVNRVLAGK